MNREEAIWYLQPIADSASLERYKEALYMAIAALRERPPWIGVEERLPTEKDANPNKSILAIDIREGLVREWIWESVARYPNDFTHWMPMPKLPTEEE